MAVSRGIIDAMLFELLMKWGSYLSIAGVVLGVAALLSPPLGAKLRVFASGTVSLLLSTDKSWNKNKVPDPDLIEGKVTRTKTIIFIRHGESEWNLIFNKGFAKLVPRLLKGLLASNIKEPLACCRSGP